MKIKLGTTQYSEAWGVPSEMEEKLPLVENLVKEESDHCSTEHAHTTLWLYEVL